MPMSVSLSSASISKTVCTAFEQTLNIYRFRNKYFLCECAVLSRIWVEFRLFARPPTVVAGSRGDCITVTAWDPEPTPQIIVHKSGHKSSTTIIHASPKFPAANISVRPAVANSLFRGFVTAHLPSGLSQSPRSDGSDSYTSRSLRDPAVESKHFRRYLKTHLFAGH